MMYSTRNLVVNGGFSLLPRDRLFGWDVERDDLGRRDWRRIPVPEADRNGVPHSAYAAVIEARGVRTEPRFSQHVWIENVPTRHFAFRLAARAAIEGDRPGLTVSFRESLSGKIICQKTFRVSANWERHRVEFHLPETATRLTIEVALRDESASRQSVAITDVRLVGLLRPLQDIAIRFDTRGDMWLASSRLRAFMLEDYLHLLGCRTSINRGRRFDLYVCQKIQPWFGLINARLKRKAIIFDLDDNDLLISRWRAAKVRGFAHAANANSVGSEFLHELAADWNSRIFLLENPVDILDPDMRRDERPWGDRLVWFGMPENRWMLDRLGLDRPVSTITRGGSVEYALKSIDKHLVTSDLALLPVFLNDATRAKNANRLVKCVGLGLPFLASDTEENRRALRILQLPVDFLVASEGDWAARIDEVARNYAHYQLALDGARPRAFELYGVEQIVADWLQFCAGLVQAKTI